MEVFRIFTVSDGAVLPGVPLASHVREEDEETVAVITFGSDRNLTKVIVEGFRLPTQGGGLGSPLMRASINWDGDSKCRSLSAAKRWDEVCKDYAIVLLLTRPGLENYHYGSAREIPLPGIELAEGRIFSARERLGSILGHGARQVLQLIPNGERFSTRVCESDGSFTEYVYELENGVVHARASVD